LDNGHDLNWMLHEASDTRCYTVPAEPFLFAGKNDLSLLGAFYNRYVNLSSSKSNVVLTHQFFSGIKISEVFWMKKPNVSIGMRKPNLDENSIKIGEKLWFT
jgi:hypothetical protein